MSNDVRESDFYANLLNSALASPHLRAPTLDDSSDFESTFPPDPAVPVDSLEYPEPKPDIGNLDALIRQHEKEFFGKPDSGVIGAVIPTRESRLLGLVSILGNFDDYKYANDLTATKIKARANKLEETLEVEGKKVRIRELIDGANAELMSVYVEKVEVNDILIQILYAIRNHRPSGVTTMSNDAYEQFADDALLVFARNEMNKAIRDHLAAIKKRTPSTKAS